MINNSNMTPSQNNIQDGSPFDLPKSYTYNEITDYHKNKALQLLKVKNLDLALLEMKGLNDCSQMIGDSSHKFDEFIFEIAKKINKRDSIRAKYIQEIENKSLAEKKEILKNFILESHSYEEYSHLQEKMIKNSNITDQTIKIFFTFDPLQYLVEIGKNEIANGLNPFILFDLDSTLFDNSPRVHKIIQDFIIEHKETYPEEIEKMSQIKRQDIVWGIKENLKKVGILHDEISDKVIRYWFDRFFSNDYIIDVPLKGANQFIQDIDNAGIRTIYLTGRFESMRQGTERNIMEHGFPLDKSGENLVLKPDPRMPDHTFKHQAMESMKKFGNMLAGFENEPLNSNIFQEHYPESHIFFLETNHSINPPNLNDSIHTLRDFSYRS